MKEKKKSEVARALNGGRAPIGKVTREEYVELKQRVLEFEKTNRKFVVLVPCEGDMDWCEMGENSALIFKYKVCLELGEPVNLTDDLDNHHVKFPLGRIRTRGYERTRRLLKAQGIYKTEVVRNKCVFFEIKPPLSEDELYDLRQKELTVQEEANSIVKADYTDPVLYQKMLNFGTDLHAYCSRDLRKLERDTNGRRIVGLLDMMMRNYFEVSTLTMSKAIRMAKWEEMYTQSHLLLAELQIMAGLKLWSRERCVMMGERIIEIKGRIKRNLDNGGEKGGKEKVESENYCKEK